MRWAFLIVAILGVVAVGAVAYALVERNDELNQQNCLAKIDLEYPPPKAKRNVYLEAAEGIGGGPGQYSGGEAQEEAEEEVAEEREEAAEAC